MVVERRTVLVVTWAGGGNLPPVLAAARLLAVRGWAVEALGSAATRAQACRCGFVTHAYRRAPEPELSVPFEAQAERLLAQAAGVELAQDVLELAQELAVDLLLVDCMLPAALVAGEAAGVPTASLVHFPYALARSVMVRGGGAWTTDRVALDATRRRLGLGATSGDLGAWESPDLLLVTLPRWFDAPGELPQHVIHAGPLGVRATTGATRAAGSGGAVVAFSTTVMEGQREVVLNVCAALERAGVEATLTLGGVLDRSVVESGAGVRVVDWLDHDQLMATCELVITHGGLGTTLRALAHGRPLLVLPLGRDQHFNAARVEALGAGLTMPADTSASAIAAAISRLLAEPEFADAARRAAAAIAAARPDETAAQALAGILRP